MQIQCSQACSHPRTPSPKTLKCRYPESPLEVRSHPQENVGLIKESEEIGRKVPHWESPHFCLFQSLQDPCIQSLMPWEARFTTTMEFGIPSFSPSRLVHGSSKPASRANSTDWTRPIGGAGGTVCTGRAWRCHTGWGSGARIAGQSAEREKVYEIGLGKGIEVPGSAFPSV